MSERKPTPTKTDAFQILNAWLKENGIILGLSKPEISFTNANQMIINPPKIMAVYQVDAIKENEIKENKIGH